MSFVAHLAARLASIAFVAPALARLKRKAVRAAIGFGLLVVFGGVGFAYFLIALRYQLERKIGPLWTPVAIGSVLCVAALVAYIALLRPRRRGQAAREADTAGMPFEMVMPMRNLEAKVANNPLPSVAVALAAGFAAAAAVRRFRRRGGYPASPWPPSANGGAEPASPRSPGDERPPWMREILLRETERRRANGRGG